MDEISLKNDIAIMRALSRLLLSRLLTGSTESLELEVRISVSQDALTKSAKHQSDSRDALTFQPQIECARKAGLRIGESVDFAIGCPDAVRITRLSENGWKADPLRDIRLGELIAEGL